MARMTSYGHPCPQLRQRAMATAAMVVFVDGGGMEPTTTTTVQWLLMPPPPSAVMAVVVVDYAAAVDATATTLLFSLTAMAKEARARVWWWQHRGWRRWQRQAVGHQCHHPVIVVDGDSKDFIADAAINRRCSRRCLSSSLSMMNTVFWRSLSSTVAVALAVVNSGDSGCHRRLR